MEFLFRLTLIAAVIAFTREDKVVEMLEEITKNLGQIDRGESEQVYPGYHSQGKPNQPEEEKPLTLKTGEIVDSLQEENNLSNANQYNDKEKLMLAKVLSLLGNFQSTSDQSKNMGEIETKELDEILTEFKRKVVGDTMPPPPVTNGLLLPHKLEEEEDDSKEVNKNGPIGLPWAAKNDVREKTPTWLPWSTKKDSYKGISKDIAVQEKTPTWLPWSTKKDSYKGISKDTTVQEKTPTWLPWSTKKDLYNDIWKDILKIQEEYKRNEKEQKKTAILKRIIGDLNELFLLEK